MEPRTYFLPWPPTANRRMGVYKGKALLSVAARKFYESAGEELMLQRARSVKGPVEISIKLCPPTKRKYDIDNRAKCAIDALVKNGVIEGDDCSIVRKLTLEASQNERPGAYVTIRKHGHEFAGDQNGKEDLPLNRAVTASSQDGATPSPRSTYITLPAYNSAPVKGEG